MITNRGTFKTISLDVLLPPLLVLCEQTTMLCINGDLYCKFAEMENFEDFLGTAKHKFPLRK